MTLIDSHHHLWEYSAEEYSWIDDSMAVLRRDFLLDELDGIARRSGVDGFVAVQARQTVEESRWLLELAGRSPRILGVVGWVPLAHRDVEEHLDRFSPDPRLCGVRHVVQDEPDDRFLLGDDFNRGVSLLKRFGLVYDVLIYARHLPAAIEFVDRHPDQPMVLDHIAKPAIDRGPPDSQWVAGIRELARRDNVSCKFSGVVTEIRFGEPWTVEDIQPYWETVLEAFTPQRLMFGSDWPVCLLKTEHARWLAAVQDLASSLSPNEQQMLFAGTAARVYGLSAE